MTTVTTLPYREVPIVRTEHPEPGVTVYHLAGGDTVTQDRRHGSAQEPYRLTLGSDPTAAREYPSTLVTNSDGTGRVGIVGRRPRPITWTVEDPPPICGEEYRIIEHDGAGTRWVADVRRREDAHRIGAVHALLAATETAIDFLASLLIHPCELDREARISALGVLQDLRDAAALAEGRQP